MDTIKANRPMTKISLTSRFDQAKLTSSPYQNSFILCAFMQGKRGLRSNIRGDIRVLHELQTRSQLGKVGRRSRRLWERIGRLLWKIGPVPLLVLCAVTFEAIDLYFLYSKSLNDVVSWTTVTLGISLVGAISLSLLIPKALLVHGWLKQLFLASIDNDTPNILVQVIVSLLLNLSYWTVVYFVGFSPLATSVPLLTIASSSIPSSFDELVKLPYAILMIVAVAGAGGPSTLFAIRYLRARMQDEAIGSRIIVALQYVFYLASLVLLSA